MGIVHPFYFGEVFITHFIIKSKPCIGNMGGGVSGGGSAMGDIVGLGIGLQAANAMSGQIGSLFSGVNGNGQTSAPATNEECIECPNCGKKLPKNAKFCLECGTKIKLLKENEIICPACGKKTHKRKNISRPINHAGVHQLLMQRHKEH